MPTQTNQVQTIEITNFSGRLTRILNGDMNSGFAKFSPSFGYDPFSKPGNLTWLEQPVDITGPVSDLIVGAKVKGSNVYAVGSANKFYTILSNNNSGPTIDSVIGISSVAAQGISFTFGASIEFYGDTEKVYVGGDQQLNSINFDGTADTRVGIGADYTANIFRPLKSQFGKMFFGNGPTIGAIDSTGTVTSSVIGINGSNIYSELNPALPAGVAIRDIESSIDGNYLLILASDSVNEQITVFPNDREYASDAQSGQYRWNGSDKAITAFTSIPGNLATAQQTYLGNNIFFTNDSFGTSLNDGTNKILTLPNNKSPFANAVVVTGNFISWVAPEIVNNASIVGSMYYFGSLDQENQPGLWRMFRYNSTQSGGFIYQTPVNILTNNSYKSLNTTVSSVVSYGYGKHYVSVYDINSNTNSYKLLRFLVTPSGTGTPQLGVYETQTQIFSKKVSIKQVRLYTEPTATGNGVQIDMIGSDGNVISSTGSWTNTYSFVAGSDPTLLQGAIERIDFNPLIKSTFAVGLRITNTGTTNMTIKKVEIDYVQSGK